MRPPIMTESILNDSPPEWEEEDPFPDLSDLVGKPISPELMARTEARLCQALQKRHAARFAAVDPKDLWDIKHDGQSKVTVEFKDHPLTGLYLKNHLGQNLIGTGQWIDFSAVGEVVPEPLMFLRVDMDRGITMRGEEANSVRELPERSLYQFVAPLSPDGYPEIREIDLQSMVRADRDAFMHDNQENLLQGRPAPWNRPSISEVKLPPLPLKNGVTA